MGLYQVYEIGTGRILSSITVSEEVAEYMRERGETLVEGSGNDQEHFVDVRISPPEIKERPMQRTRQDKASIRADGRDFMTLSDLPRPCVVKVGAERYEVPDGILEWGTRRAGEYPLRVVAFPWLDWGGMVTAE